MNAEREMPRLLDRLSDGALSSEDAARLDELLQADPIRLETYLEHMELDALLGWHFGRQARLASDLEAACGEKTAASDISTRLSRVEPGRLSLNKVAEALAYLALGGPVRTADRWSTAAALVAAYAVFYGAFLSLLWSMRPLIVAPDAQRRRQIAELAAEELAKGVATLVDAKDCQWEAGRAPAPIGGRITAAQTLRLRSGQAALRFDGGAEIGIVGPAAVQPRSGGRLFLNRGRLAAHVPARAWGFTVETVSARLVDLGTDFAVDVSESGETKTIVTRGVVEVTPLAQPDEQRNATGSPVRITAGQSIVVSPSGNRSEVDRAAKTPEWWSELNPSNNPPMALVAYQTVSFDAGNQSQWSAGLGLDFDVLRPIRVESLGVFDHLGDGIDPRSPLTVQLWARNNHGTPQNPRDDSGERVLAERRFDGASQGVLLAGHRFLSLATPIELRPGSYSIIAYGFSEINQDLNFTYSGIPRRLQTWDGAIAHVSSRNGGTPGEFPQTVDPINYAYVAGSFKFSPVERAPTANSSAE